MTQFREEGSMDVGPERLGMARELFAAARLDDAAVARVIATTHRRTGMIVDPHTAVGLGAAGICHLDRSVPIVCLATAHPAKFPDAVEAAIGIRPELPEHLADLFERPERLEEVANDLGALEALVAARMVP
jgi:threonine synthase